MANRFKSRKHQIPITRQLKISTNKKWQKDYMFNLFREIPLVYNHFLSILNDTGKLVDDGYASKCSKINLINRENEQISIQIKYVCSQMRQAIKYQLNNALISLTALKKNGHKVGKLKFRKFCNALGLSNQQYKFVSDNRISFMGMSKNVGRNKSFYVYRYKQIQQLKSIDSNLEFGDSWLVRKPNGIYLNLVCWLDKQKWVDYLLSKQIFPQIGVDFGVKHPLSISSGYSIDFLQNRKPDYIRKAHKNVSKKKRSKNHKKAKLNLKLKNQKWKNQKKEIHNKLVGFFRLYQQVNFQDESIKSWYKLWGSKLECFSLGEFLTKLETSIVTPKKISKWVPTTQTCSDCGCIEKIDLNTRIYECKHCGFICDRDINSARNMILGQELAEVTPVEHIITSLILGNIQEIKVNYVL